LLQGVQPAPIVLKDMQKTPNTPSYFGGGEHPPPPRGPGPPHSRGIYITHNDAPQSVGLLWTSDQLVAETSTWQHTTVTTNIYDPREIRTHNLSRRAAVDLRLRPRGYWDRLTELYQTESTNYIFLFHKFPSCNRQFSCQYLRPRNLCHVRLCVR
jgi:hypothetical protein